MYLFASTLFDLLLKKLKVIIKLNLNFVDSSFLFPLIRTISDSIDLTGNNKQARSLF